MPGPQVCVGGCLRVVARGMAVGGRFRGASGTPPLRFAREWAAAGASPSSGPAGPPSPKGEGKGCCWRRRKVSRGVGDAAPCGLPGNGRQRGPAPHPALRGHLPPRGKARAVGGGGGRSRRGGGTPPYGWGYGNAVGFTRTPVPGPPHGRGRACPARGVTQAPVNGSVRREGS